MASTASTNLTAPLPPRAGGALYRLAVIVLLLIVGLSVFDRFLANLESTELARGAQRDYENGLRLLKGGTPAAAIEPLQSAHSTERENQTYELALIRALADSGRTADAGPLMDEVLARLPNDGSANLEAARLAIKTGDEDAAQAYYHRAIFGRWSGADALARQTAARLELIDHLAAKGQLQPLLAELISLNAESPTDPAVQAKIARLFLTAGSPDRSATAWQTYLSSRQDRGDNESAEKAWAGLGEAELQAGEYQKARTAFREAQWLNPNDVAVKSRFELVDMVAALDPTPHQLSAAAKHARAVRILDMANADLTRCSPSASPVDPAKLDAEELLAAAQQTWQLRVKTCAGISNDEDALRLIMRKLAAQ